MNKEKLSKRQIEMVQRSFLGHTRKTQKPTNRCSRCRSELDKERKHKNHCFRCHRLITTPSLDEIIGETIDEDRFTHWIYFVEACGLGFMKIGITAGESVSERLGSIQTGCPVKVELVLSIPGDTATERAIHKHFHKQRSYGEWFSPSDELDRFMKDLKDAHLLHKIRKTGSKGETI
jgi:hypothetical protein